VATLTVATELERRSVDGLRNAGISRCQVFVNEANEPALAFWEELGAVRRPDLQVLSIDLN
jgi:hypothetical protein